MRRVSDVVAQRQRTAAAEAERERVRREKAAVAELARRQAAAEEEAHRVVTERRRVADWAQRTLRELGVEELLRDVRDNLWHCGELTQEERGALLAHRFPGLDDVEDENEDPYFEGNASSSHAVTAELSAWLRVRLDEGKESQGPTVQVEGHSPGKG